MTYSYFRECETYHQRLLKSWLLLLSEYSNRGAVGEQGSSFTYKINNVKYRSESRLDYSYYPAPPEYVYTRE